MQLKLLFFGRLSIVFGFFVISVLKLTLMTFGNCFSARTHLTLLDNSEPKSIMAETTTDEPRNRISKLNTASGTKLKDDLRKI